MQVYDKMFCTSIHLTAASHWVRFDQCIIFSPFNGNTSESRLYCVEILDTVHYFAEHSHENTAIKDF